MPEQRYSLEEAAKLLGGLHPNTVRNRAAKGKLPFEKDNTGKWWVFLDPEKVANQPRPVTKPLPMEATMEAPIVSVISTLEATIVSLREELAGVREERDHLKERADLATRLEEQLSGLQERLAATGEGHTAWKEEAERTISDLRARLDRVSDENRTALLALLAKMTAAEARASEERGGGLFGWFRRRKA